MKECDYNCSCEETTETDNSKDTLSLNMIEDLLNEIILLIKNLYKYDYIYKLEELIRLVQQTKYFRDDYIKLAINKLLQYKNHDLDKELLFSDKDNIKGKLILCERGNIKYLLFQPLNIKNRYSPIYYRINNNVLNNNVSKTHIDITEIAKNQFKADKEKEQEFFNLSIDDLQKMYDKLLISIRQNNGITEKFKTIITKIKFNTNIEPKIYLLNLYDALDHLLHKIDIYYYVFYYIILNIIKIINLRI